ncbi:stc1 domain-containing protein [Ophiocordyceps camponoti-floridani]|uniref:Stc1 domain-containing protein n=1 Tax=Ophiocordyceps camponoti-floridani TaxID=2030778 RepID=A0A8H4Q540_9HYPO|nr:stc1 domain-containing protein [Ophiocordyceps camponoti-floridani]
MPRSRKTPLDLGTGQPAAPTRFRCKVGGEWLPLTSFSNAQQKLVQRQIGRHGSGPVNPANSGMTCRDHSAASRTELRCELCTLIKPITEFSRNSRQSDENICKRCSAWDETQEPNVTPAPLETGHVSIEEMNREVWQQNYVESNDFFDELPRAPITELASLGLEDDTTVKARLSGIRSQNAGLTESEAMAKLVSDAMPNSGPNSGSSLYGGRSSESGSVHSMPPHLRGRYQSGSDLETATTDSLPVSSSSSQAGTGSVSGSALPPHLRKLASKGNSDQAAKIPFNAWGPDGNLRQGLKSVTANSSNNSQFFTDTSHTKPSSTSCSAANSTSGSDNGYKGKDKKPTRKGGFAKPPRLSRADMHQFDGCTPIGVAHIDPSIEQMRKMQYCQSEDSDY